MQCSLSLSLSLNEFNRISARIAGSCSPIIYVGSQESPVGCELNFLHFLATWAQSKAWTWLWCYQQAMEQSLQYQLIFTLRDQREADHNQVSKHAYISNSIGFGTGLQIQRGEKSSLSWLLERRTRSDFLLSNLRIYACTGNQTEDFGKPRLIFMLSHPPKMSALTHLNESHSTGNNQFETV